MQAVLGTVLLSLGGCATCLVPPPTDTRAVAEAELVFTIAAESRALYDSLPADRQHAALLAVWSAARERFAAFLALPRCGFVALDGSGLPLEHCPLAFGAAHWLALDPLDGSPWPPHPMHDDPPPGPICDNGANDPPSSPPVGSIKCGTRLGKLSVQLGPGVHPDQPRLITDWRFEQHTYFKLPMGDPVVRPGASRFWSWVSR